MMRIEDCLPLQGKTIVVTRSQEQQGEAFSLFQGLGARVVDLPALVITPPENWGPLDDALADLEDFHWIVFSSANGVRSVEERLKRMGGTLSCRPSTLKIAAVGRKTAQNLKDIGAQADFVPPSFHADSLIKHFPGFGLGLRMLLPRVQSGGRTVLSEAFADAGLCVVEVAAYESSCPDEIPETTLKVIADGEADAIVFTSGKTAAHTAELLKRYFGKDWKINLKGTHLISIGPQTSLSCKKYFGKIDKEADPHDIDGLINACIECLKVRK